MKGRRILALLCAFMIFAMNFSSIPALAAASENEQTETVSEEKTKAEKEAKDKTDDKAENKADKKADKKAEDKADKKAEDKADKKVEDKADKKVEDKADDKAKDKADDKTDDKAAEKEAAEKEAAKEAAEKEAAEKEAAEKEAAKKAEEEAKKAEEEAKKAEEEAKKAEEEAKKAEEEAKKAEEEAKKAEEEAKKADEEAEKAKDEPTEAPVEKPTEAPADEPTKAPADEPTEAPVDEPTEAPVDEPTEAPADEPTEAPADEPTEAPADEPTEAPADEPTEAPADEPTEAPVDEPTDEPTEEPTEAPTEEPTAEPTEEPQEPLTLTNLSASATEVFPGEKITFTFETTGAERVEYSIYNGSDLVVGGEADGNSFSWTPDALGTYMAAVTAIQGDDSITTNITVTVKAEYSDVRVTFTAVDAEGNGVGGLVDVELAKGEYNLKSDAPAAVQSEKNYEYVKTQLNGDTVKKLVYSDADRAWLATVGGDTFALTEDVALLVLYKEVFNDRVYQYEDRNIYAVVTLARASAVPDDAELVVTPITGGKSYKAYMQALNDNTDPEQEYTDENTLLYDFAFMAKELDPETGLPTGKTVEVKPEKNTMKVEVTFKKNQISNVAGDDATAEDVSVVHMPLKDSVLDRVDATVDATNISAGDIKTVDTISDSKTDVNLNGSTDAVEFQVDSFSVFAFTVDFHYNGVDYSIPGMSQILLSELIVKLNIKNGGSLLDVKDVERVEFTDEHLVTVEQVSGVITYNNEEGVDVGDKDFLLTSKEPFTSDETLTIWLTNGMPIVVGVTDASDVKEYTLSAGEDSLLIAESLYPLQGLSNSGEYLVYWSDYGYPLINAYDSAGNLIYQKTSTGVDSFESGLSTTVTDTDVLLSGLSKIPGGDYITLWVYDSITNDYNNNDWWRFKIIQPEGAEPVGAPLTDGIFNYRLNDDGTVTIIGMNILCNNTDITILNEATLTVDGEEGVYTVAGIADEAFKGNDKIENVYFRDMVAIGDSAFAKCWNLNELVFYDSVTIGEWAFASSNFKSVEFRGKTNIIGDYAFDSCKRLETAKVTYGGSDGDVQLGTSAFSLCDNLVSFTSTSGVSQIGANAFSENPKLSNFSIGTNRETAIGYNAFSGCSSLEGALEFQSGISEIGGNAFWGTGITSITTTRIGDLGYGAFGGMKQAPDITLNVGSIYANTEFAGWSGRGNFKSLTINADAIKFGSWALEGQHTGLETLTINSKSAIDLSGYMFQNISNAELKAININAPVGVINGYAFNKLGNVNTAEPVQVNLNKGVSTINANAFANIQGDVVVNIADNGGTTVVKENSFPNEGYLTVNFDMYKSDVTGATSYLDPLTATTITYKEKTSDTIDDGIFTYEIDLTKKSALITGFVESFQGQDDLDVPATVKYTFAGEDAETEIPVTAIAEGAFQEDSRVKNVTFKGEPTIGTKAFYKCANLGKVVFDGDAKIAAGADGSGVFQDSGITSVEFKGTNVDIGAFAFKHCHSLTAVNTNKADVSIGDQAFNMDAALKGKIGGVNSIGNFAFYGAAIETIGVKDPTVVKTFPGYAFSNKVALDVDADTITLNHGILNGSYTNSFHTITFNVKDLSFGSWAMQSQGSQLNKIVINNETALNLTATEIFGDEKAGDLTFEFNGPVNTVGWRTFMRLGQNSDATYTINFNKGVNSINGNAFEDATFGGKTIVNVADNGGKTTVYSNTFPDSENLEVHFDMYRRNVTGSNLLDALVNSTITYKDVPANEIFTFEYDEEKQEAVITGLADAYEDDGNVVIPATIKIDDQDYTVTGFSEDAFKGENRLKTVSIPDGIDTIPAGAFADCENLTAVTLGADGDNAGKELTVGKGALVGSKVTSTVTVKQTVESDAGTVVLAASEDGTRLAARLDVQVIAEDEAIKAAADEYYADAKADVVVDYYNITLLAPNGDKVSAAADVTLPMNVNWTPTVAVQTPNGVVFHKVGDSVERVEGAQLVLDGVTLTAATFHTDSFSPFATAYESDNRYHDDMFWYTLTKDANGTVTEAVVVGVYDEYEGKELEFTNKTRDDNGYPVKQVQAGAFAGNESITKVALKNTSAFTLGERAFAGSKVETVIAQGAEEGAAYAGSLTIGKNAFEGCGSLKSVVIGSDDLPASGTVMVYEDAFKSSAIKEFVCVAPSSIVYVRAGAFAECALDKAVLEYKAGGANKGAFPNPVTLVRVNKQPVAGAFNGGKTFVLNGTVTLQASSTARMSDRVGKFDNYVFTGAFNMQNNAVNYLLAGDNVASKIYIDDTATTNYIITAIQKAGSGLTDVYINQTREYTAQKHSSDSKFVDKLESANANVKIHYVGDAELPIYVDGKDGNDETGDGSYDKPYKTFAGVKAALDNKTYVSQDDEFLDLVDTACADAGLSYTATRGSEEKQVKVYVKNTISVTGTEEWESTDPTNPIVLNRDPQFKGVMVQNSGTLTLKNVVLDGGAEAGIEATAPIIKSEGTLNIQDGAVIRNNKRSRESYPDGAGGIYASGSITMTGGEISGNTGRYGGGIEAIGSSTVFDMEGGEIKDNTANGGASGFGGGVLIASGATMNLSGGTISGNRAIMPQNSYNGAGGGGIAVGGGVSGMCQKATLNMNGGTISDNEAENNGGGISIQDNCVANIEGGKITGNTAYDGMFGGGGIYVNGKREVADGVLNLTNALITGNTARQEGGGLAGCSTSNSAVYYINGGAIYSNSSKDGSDVYASLALTGPYYRDSLKGHVTGYMFNGTPYNWIDVYTGKKATPAQLANIRTLSHNSDIGLKADPDGTQPTSAAVTITGNKSETKGGGIGSNGSVNIGSAPSPQDVKWTPEADKVLYNRDMKDDETFTFTVYEEKTSQGINFWWKKYNDVKVGEGSVTGGKDGEAKAIEFDTIDLGNVTEANVGSTRTFLIVEDTPADAKVKAPKQYLAITVVIGGAWDKEAGKEVYSAEVQEIAVGKILDNGAYEFSNRLFDGEPNEDATATENFGRIRAEVDEAVFENFSTETSVSADKTWLNCDGSKTAPTGAKVTFELYADGKATGKTVELDGTADESGESKAWTATWTGLDAYRSEDGQLVKDDDGNYVKIAYTVKETKVELADGSYATYTSDAPEEGAAATSTAPAKITNKQETGDLEVSKTVVSDAAADADQTFTFTVTLTNDETVNGEYGDMTFEDGVANVTLKGGESAKAEGLPTGITYKVEEAANDDFTTAKSGDEGEISTEKSEAEFTNTRKTGDLEISKTVVSDAAADADEEFEFTVTLSDKTIGKTYSGVEFTKGVATVTLKGGETKLIEGLPTGITYTVVETVNDDFTTAKSGDEGEISTEKSEAKFTNTRKMGELEISKTVVSDAAADKTQEFEFTVTLSGLTEEAANNEYSGVKFTEGEATVILKGGQSKSIKGLPTGITYTVVETANGDFTTAKSGDEGEISTAKSEAKFTNTRKMGELEISKTVVSDAVADADEVFEFTVTLSDKTISKTYSGVEFIKGVATVTLKGGEAKLIEGLPTGITYTVEETETAGFTTKPASRIVDGVIGEEKSEAAFTNTRRTGERRMDDQVTVEKVDDQGYRLEGATFILYADKGLETEIKTYTDKTFTISTKDDELADYLPKVGKKTTLYLAEKTAPKGYKLDDTVREVVVSATLTHAIENDVYVAITTYTVEIDGSGATLTVPNTPVTDAARNDASVTVTKVDAEDETKLEGAKFTLYSGDTAVKTYTTDKDGELVISTGDEKLAQYLPEAGATTTLTLKETKAPMGYVASTNSYRVIIAASERIDWDALHTKLVTTTTYAITIEGKAALTVPNIPDTDSAAKHGSVTVTKVDAEDETKLEGAKFTLYSGATAIDSYTTDANGKLTISTKDAKLADYLPKASDDAVTLTLKETEAPKGYVKSDASYSVKLTASEATAWNAAHTKLVTTTTYAITIEGKAELTVPNSPDTDTAEKHGSVTVTKVDADDAQTKLEGAVFTLYSGVTAIDSYTTDANGELTIRTDDVKLAGYLPKAGGTTTLTLKETEAPEGYVKSDAGYSVKLTASEATAWNAAHTKLVTTTTYAITVDGRATLSVPNPTVVPTATPTTAPTATPTPTPTPTPATPGGNQPTPTPIPRTEISGAKVWVDEDNIHNTRPSDVTIQLLANGQPVDATPTWTSKSGNRWTFTFSNLPEVDDSGARITYTVREIPVSGYTGTVSGTTITNKLDEKTPERYVELGGEKTWQDNNNAKGLRPTSITVHLLRDGVVVETRQVTAGTDWKYTFGKQPADDGYGNEYTYTIREDAVEGYYTRYSGFDVTNSVLNGGTPDEPTDDGDTPATDGDTPKGGGTPMGGDTYREYENRETGTPAPEFEDMSDEELEELFDLFGYGTPLAGIFPTGDEIPAWVWYCGGGGVLALALALILGKRKKRKA